MEKAIATEVSKVFGLSEDDTLKFLDVMQYDFKGNLPRKDYFTNLLEKMPKAKYFTIPKPPEKYNMSEMSESTKRMYESYYNEQYKQYEKDLERFAGRETSKEDEIYYNTTKGTHGAFGVVRPNKNKPQYIYKEIRINQTIEVGNEDYESSVKSSLLEPLLNTILQTIPEAKPFTCKLHNVFIDKVDSRFYSYYHIIMRMENIEGRSVYDTLLPRFPFLYEKTPNSRNSETNNENLSLSSVAPASEQEKQYNKKLLVKIMAPLYKVLKKLYDTYRFRHGDMHKGNLMFVENPLKKDGTFDMSKLAVKMIDFAYSTITIGEHQYGSRIFHRMLHKEVSIFYFLSQANQLPDDMTEQVNTFAAAYETKDYLNALDTFKDYIIQQGEAMTGGRRKQTRRQKKQKNTRRR